ncbi:FecR domain-containing protein [Sphingomonas sp. ST-64]|uniref:FecR domain-containing protein n=1 Tax=Sphingomonas plantiphila TaxID=3163295 RepID=A0ABW8YNM0_9SPHN
MTADLPEPTHLKPASEIDAAAADWAARIDGRPLDAAEEAAFASWLEADSRHAGAYARALAVNAYFDRAVALGPDFAPVDPAPPSPAAFAVPVGRRTAMLGGGALLAASAAGVLGWSLAAKPNAIETAKGDLRRVTLAEGSAITLNTDSRVEPRIEGEQREAELARGEALFDIAPDPDRPFVVHAGAVAIRVLGTRFAVRRFDDGGVALTVLEGLVEVSTQGGARLERLAGGERSHITPGAPIRTERVPQEALERAVGWRNGLIDLNGMTLEQAAAEYARYSSQRIEIADPATRALRVTGVYSTSDPIGFARAAALSLGLSAERTDAGIRLQPG